MATNESFCTRGRKRPFGFFGFLNRQTADNARIAGQFLDTSAASLLELQAHVDIIEFVNEKMKIEKYSESTTVMAQRPTSNRS